MLKRKGDSLHYISDTTGLMYDVEMGMSIVDQERTSDRCFILTVGMTEDEYKLWENGDYTKELDERIVGWFYGVGTENDDNFENTIKEYVDEYERKKKYPFTEQGVKDFYDDSIDNSLEMLNKVGRAIDIDVKVGDMEITIPDTADNYERLGAFLKECQEDTVPIRNEDRKEKIMETNQNNYNVEKVICNSCYSEVFLKIMNIMHEEFVDGWYAMEFLSWLKKTSEDFQHYLDTEDCDGCKDIFFATFSDYEDEVSNIIYGTNLQCCVRTEKYVKYYRICLTWDAKLEKVSPILTIEERILKTLEAYYLTNKEVLEEIEIKDLEEQIEYIKTKIKEV